MRILFVTQPGHSIIPSIESSRITVELLADELRKRKHKVDILRTKKMFPKIDNKYDIIHGFSAAPIMALRTWYLGLKLNAHKTVHTIKSESMKFKTGKFFLDFVDEVTFPTEVLRTKFNYQKHGNIIRSNINLNKFKPKKTKKDIDVLYYGATWESKGIKELCEAVRGTNIKTLIISRNPIPFEWNLNQYFYIPNIRWMVGSIDNIEDYINRAKFVVLPYKTLKGTENIPPCLLEAIACKVPVITSRLPEIREVFDNTEVLQIDPYKLRASILHQLKYYKEAMKRANKAYKKIKQFDTKEITKQYEQIYNG